MLSSTDEPRSRWSAVRACRLAAVLATGLAAFPAATPSLAASAVEIDLGAIDTLPPAKGGSAGAPIELKPPAAIRAEIVKREAARRAAARRAAEERKRADTARKAAAKRRAAEERRKAD